MHILSLRNRSEFLACPQLVRFDYARGQNYFEPTLLIKGSTLLLKYIVLGARMQLAFAMCEERLICAVHVYDDGDKGGILWSVVERVDELEAIRGLARGEPLVAFLFNEIAVNVAWNNLPRIDPSDRLSAWVDQATLGEVDHENTKPAVKPLLDQLHQSDNDQWLVLEIGAHFGWKSLQNHFITARAVSSVINLFDQDEGSQQEQLGVWLTDNLQTVGAYYSPQIPVGSRTRELTDILLSHSFGAILIESKTLSILKRERLQDRAKLKRDVSGHVKKAFTQLRGAMRALRSGINVQHPNGEILEIDRKNPAHAIVLVPDLDLIENHSAYGIEFIRDFMTKTDSFPHLLDISELLRVVQAAEAISMQGKTITPMMAFDYYLMQRIEKAVTAGTLCITVLLRLEDPKLAETC